MGEPWKRHAMRNKPDAKGQIRFYLYEVPRIGKFMETGSTTGIPGAGGRGEWDVV